MPPAPEVSQAEPETRQIAPEPLTAVPRALRTPVPVVVVDGAVPAPPPITSAFAASAALELSAEVELKYGTPPLVPAGVQVKVPDDVTGDPLTEHATLLGADKATLVTEPPPDGVAHVLSPRR